MARKQTRVNLGIKVGRLRDIAASQLQAEYAEKARRAAGLAAYRGAEAMRNKILDSPTGTSWHKAVSEMRGHPGGRVDTGTMLGAATRNRGRIEAPRDRRMAARAIAAFGWPANSDGLIKDAPSSPAGPPGEGSWEEWRTDPRYFVMQEYGFDNEGDWVPGMYSQREGVKAAAQVLQEFYRKNGFK